MQDNKNLFKEYAKNKDNIDLRNKIVLNNLKLVPYTINRYHLYIEDIHNYDEMLQDGYIALIKAVESFDYSLGYKFSSYAIKCILELTRNRLDYNKDISIDAPIKDDEEDFTLLDTIKDDAINIEKEAIEKDFYLQIRNKLSLNLNNIELNIIYAIYGINQEIKSYKDIADDLNMDISKVRSIKNKAETKIKNSSYFRHLYLERNPISYYQGINFNSIKTSPTNKINSPVEYIAMRRENLNRSLIIDTVRHKKRNTQL